MKRIVCTLALMAAVSCGKADAGPSKEMSTLGAFEVTAKLTEIRSAFPPNKLYDYVYVFKYKVLQVYRGAVAGDEIFVGHYNPLKPRSGVQDKLSGKIGGSLREFRAGDVHRMALDAPLDEHYMGGIIDKYHKEKGIRYWGIYTDPVEGE